MSVDCCSRRSPVAVALLTCFAVTQLYAPAWAYRPFDGTDAAVADSGEVEIELQPAGPLQHGSDKTLVAPATVINFGLPGRWEAGVQGQGELPISTSDQSAVFTDVGASVKHVLRPGSLQDESGPSIATEIEVLLPGIKTDEGFGVSVAGIVSQRFEWGAIHFNAETETALTREHHTVLFVSTILEGPPTWTTPRRGNLLRQGVPPITHGIRAHRRDMAGSRRLGLRHRISSCPDERTPCQ
jgi:hypothetical protein